VTRLPHDTDRRTNQIEITKVGQVVLAEISEVAASLRNQLLDGVAGEDLIACLRVFAHVQGKLEEDLGDDVQAKFRSRSRSRES
jgi:DNA-binding MarR family transcriptional regulator